MLLSSRAAAVGRPLCLALVFSLAACGGGGSGAEDRTANPQTLTEAGTYREFVDRINARFGNVIDHYVGDSAAYDHSVEQVTGGTAFTGGLTNPVAGSWRHYAAVNYPASNGYFQFAGTGTPRKLSYRAVDTTNHAQGNGDAQVFFGVRDLSIGQGPATRDLRTLIVGEVIVRDESGVDLYRAIQIWHGAFPSYSPTYLGKEGPPYQGAASLFYGRYRLVAVECFVSECMTGLLLDYYDYMKRE